MYYPAAVSTAVFFVLQLNFPDPIIPVPLLLLVLHIQKFRRSDKDEGTN